MSGSIKPGRRSIRAGLLGVAMVIVTAAPAMAVVDNVECNWLGYNCRGFWSHGTTSTTVWSNYKQLDLRHGSSVFGNTSNGTPKSNDSGCVSANTWSYANLSGVTNGRQAYYRNC